MNREELDELIAKEDIVECPNCLQLNAHCWDDSNMESVGPWKWAREAGTENDVRDIYHIPSASGFEWQCGYCGTSWADIDSPIMAEVYTHIPRKDYDDEQETR